MANVSAQDLKVLEEQLKRPPRNVISVETRCPAGHPQVILVYPLIKEGKRWEPFPTIYWLTCPSLVAQLAALEHVSWIRRLEREIRSDATLKRELEKNHKAYIEERWALLSDEDKQGIEKRGWTDIYLKRGIGGIENWNHLKCLHLHYAHHLARENVIGRWIHRMKTPQPCR